MSATKEAASQAYVRAFEDARRAGEYVFIPALPIEINLGIFALRVTDNSVFRTGDVILQKRLPPGFEAVLYDVR